MALPPLPSVVHPIFVHFTVALIPTATAFAGLYAWKRLEWARQATYAVLTAVAIFALFTMGSGFRDYFAVAPELEGTPARDLLEWHERIGVVTTITVVATTLVAWWKRKRVAASPRWAWALAIALAVATALAILGAWYGGSLVYDHGVRVTTP